MSSFLVVNAAVTNIDKLKEYGAAVGPTLAGHEFKVHVSSNDATTLEGSPAGSRVVIMEFPDRAALLRWYESDAYQAVIGLRHAGTEGFAVIVDGR